MRRLALSSLAGLLLASGVTSCGKQENQTQQKVQLTEVKATSTPFSINGISSPSDPAKLNDYLKELSGHMKGQHLTAAVGGAVPYTDVIMYSSISCQADWNVHCAGELDFVAPPGYQVCKPAYTIASTNNSQGFSFAPINWYENDSERPPRFRGYHFHIEANGSGTPLNQTGSNITLTSVGIRVIAAAANNFDRYATGCDMPAH